jgi:hypothetical protein
MSLQHVEKALDYVFVIVATVVLARNHRQSRHQRPPLGCVLVALWR